MAYHHDPDAVRPVTGPLVAINEKGVRMGEGHGRAKLTDHEVDLVHDLLAARDMLMDEYLKVGLPRWQIARALCKAQLSYGGIAAKMEVSKSLIKAYADGKLRARKAVEWKKVQACI